MALHSLRLALPPPSTFTAMPNSAANNLSPHTSNIYINIYIKRRSAKSSAQNHSTLNHDQTLILSFHEIHHSKHLGDTTPFTTIRIKKKTNTESNIFYEKWFIDINGFYQTEKKPSLGSFWNLGPQMHFIGKCGICVANDSTRSMTNAPQEQNIL